MKVCFTYLGSLQYRGRLFKQIKTLQTAGFECLLIHGHTDPEPPNYSVYDFPVLSIHVVQEKFKILTFASQLQFAYKASKLIEKIGADAVVSVALQSALSGAIAKSRNPALRFIFDSKELFLESFDNRLKKGIWAKIQNYVLKWADIVMHAEQRRMEYFHRTYKTAARPFVLENLPFYRVDPHSAHERSKKIRCVYVGIFMPDRFCKEMLNAFSELNRSDVTFDMVGFYGRPNYEETMNKVLEQIDTSRIRILPPVSHSDMYDFLAHYDIGLAFYRNTDLNNYYCAPNKVYDYFQMGIPVITNDYPGLIDVVQKKEVGICIPSVDIEHIEGAIQKIEANNIHANITETIRKRYSWENQEKDYIQLFA